MSTFEDFLNLLESYLPDYYVTDPQSIEDILRKHIVAPLHQLWSTDQYLWYRQSFTSEGRRLSPRRRIRLDPEVEAEARRLITDLVNELSGFFVRREDRLDTEEYDPVLFFLIDHWDELYREIYEAS